MKTEKCGLCGVEIEIEMDAEEEAARELEANFPGEKFEDCNMVCDDCYQRVMEHRNERAS